MGKGTFVKMPRALLDDERLKKPIVWNVYTHLLLMANYNDGVFKGTNVPSGSLVTSYGKLAKATGYTRDQIRNAINTIVLAQLVTRNSTQSYMLITIDNWGDFQGLPTNNNAIENAKVTQKLRKTSQQSKNNKEYKEYKENRNINISITAPSYESSNAVAKLATNKSNDFYYLYQEDIDKYKEYYPAIDIDQEIRNISAWLETNPKNRKTHNGMPRFINGWLSRAQNKTRAYGNRPKEKKGVDWFYE